MANTKKGSKEGKVKFSDTFGDEQSKHRVSDAVNRSGLTVDQKKAIYREVFKGQLSRLNAEVCRKILRAEDTGGTYIPPVAGQL